jgi:hypothetical protein
MDGCRAGEVDSPYRARGSSLSSDMLCNKVVMSFPEWGIVEWELKTVVPVAALMGRYYSRAERQWRVDRDEKTPESVAVTGELKNEGRGRVATAHNVTVASCGRAWIGGNAARSSENRWEDYEAVKTQCRRRGMLLDGRGLLWIGGMLCSC